MAMITGPGSVIKGDRNDIFFDKDQFLASVTITDPFFANDRNWKRVVLVFMDPLKKQKQFAILTDNWTRANFEPTVTARTGVWSLEEVHIYDMHMGLYIVSRAHLPSPEDFDVEATRLVAPSPTATAIETADVVGTSNFNIETTIEEAGWTQVQNNGSEVTIESQQAKLSTGTIGLGTIKLQKTFSLESGERYLAKIRPVDRQNGVKIVETREPTSGDIYSRLAPKNHVQKYGTNPYYFYWGDTLIGSSASNTLVSGGYTYYQGTYRENNLGTDFWGIYRVSSTETTGVVNDLGIFVRDNLGQTITSSIISVADGSLHSLSFIAEGTTTISIETSGEQGYWVIDDLSLEKNPDALSIPLADVVHYKIGYKVKLWDVAANAFLTEDIYTITNIDVDVLTFDKAIAGDFTGKTILVKFPDYDNSSAEQKGLYQYVGKGF